MWFQNSRREKKISKYNLMKILKSISLRKFVKPAAVCISLLFIISMVSLFDIAPVQGAATYTFGNTAVGTLTNSFSTDRDASRFQLTQSGLVQSITAYFANEGFNAKAAIYTDNNGAPSTLITQSNTKTVTASGWQTFTVPESSLTAGYYWLSVVSDTYSKGAMTATSTNTHAWKTSSYSGEFTSTFGTPSGYEKTATSIYATYTTTTTMPPPTPTASPTPPSTSTTYTFGNTVVGTLTNSFSTDKDASRFQLTQNGVLQSITAYFANTGFNAKAAIYTDNNGAPSTLITQSNTKTVTASGWQTFTVPESSLTAGYYWLSVVSDTYSKGAMTATSTNTHAWKTSSYSGEFASTFGTPSGYEKTATSIYATYTTTTTMPTSTPTPTPPPTSTAFNLAPVPDGWSYANTRQTGIGSSPYIVYPVNWQGKTNVVRMDWSQAYANSGWAATCEANSYYLQIKPGDHVVLKAWFWVPQSTVGDNNNPYSGGLLNVDLRGSQGRICALATSDGKQSYDAITRTYASASAQSSMIVQFGTQTWEQVTMDFVVQNTYISDGWGGMSAGQYATPTGMIPLIAISTGNTQTEKASVYFAGTEIYINP